MPVSLTSKNPRAARAVTFNAGGSFSDPDCAAPILAVAEDAVSILTFAGVDHHNKSTVSGTIFPIANTRQRVYRAVAQG